MSLQTWTLTMQSPDCSTVTFTPTFLIAGDYVHAPNACTAPALEPGWVSSNPGFLSFLPSPWATDRPPLQGGFVQFPIYNFYVNKYRSMYPCNSKELSMGSSL
jgi:hypothetical protein